MSYSNITGILDKIDERTLVQTLNDENAAYDLTDPADQVVLNFSKAAAAAQAEIDPYLRHRYTLPFTSVPQRIVDLSDDISIYNCYKRRGNIPEERITDYKNAVKSLQDISKGIADLGIEDEPQSIKNEIKTNKTASDRTFNNDVWDKY